jgi:hypothetical protein
VSRRASFVLLGLLLATALVAALVLGTLLSTMEAGSVWRLFP